MWEEISFKLRGKRRQILLFKPSLKKWRSQEFEFGMKMVFSKKQIVILVSELEKFWLRTEDFQEQEFFEQLAHLLITFSWARRVFHLGGKNFIFC